MIKKKFVTAAARRSTRNPPAQTRMSMTRIDGAGTFLMALFHYKSSGGDEINKIQNWSHRLGRAASWSGVFNIHERLRRPKWRLAPWNMVCQTVLRLLLLCSGPVIGNLTECGQGMMMMTAIFTSISRHWSSAGVLVHHRVSTVAFV